MSFSKYVDNFPAIHGNKGISELKKSELINHGNAVGKWNAYYSVNEANLKGYTLYDSNYTCKHDVQEKVKLWK